MGGKEDYSKTEIVKPFLQNCLKIFEDKIRKLPKTNKAIT